MSWVTHVIVNWYWQHIMGHQGVSGEVTSFAAIYLQIMMIKYSSDVMRLGG